MMLDVEQGYHIGLTNSEAAYYAAMREIKEYAHVGAGIGSGFANTNKLKVMKYKEAMRGPDKQAWEVAVEELERMKKFLVWEEVPRSLVPKQAKILTSTWARKKKANGTFRARLNARGYEQVDGKHYHSHNISSPVANEVTIRIALVLMLFMRMFGELIDVKGAFLHGDFEDEYEVYMEVPEGMDKHYDRKNCLLRLLKTLYGLKNSAMAFWRKI